MRELDSVSIAMTDYGFWDIEVNATNDITYSYSGKKEVEQFQSFFEDESKLTRPDIGLGSSGGGKFIEYDDLWTYTESDLTGYWTSLKNSDGVKYWDYIIGGTGKRLDFRGGTQNFGVYAGVDDTYIDVLVSMDLIQFKSLLFANPELVRLLVDWLYRQVVYSGDHNLPAFGEYYLYNNHVNQDGNGFIWWLGQNNRLSHTFPNIQFQGMNQDLVHDRFQSMVQFIREENPSSNTLQGYCEALYAFSQ